MNFDFHYYGTYCAARIAGFDATDANQIAWAAEMVDDCTDSLLNKIGIPDTNRVITSETFTDNLTDETSFLSDVTNATLKKVQRIWMPFHFLPGNLPADHTHQVYTGSTKWVASTYGVRDGSDFDCLCLHNSALLQAIVDDTQNRYHTNSATRQELLYLTGIRMHVLADTWAHEFFVGTPNYWINDVAEIKRLNPYGLDISEITSVPSASSYSMFYLGHARLGHLPDIPLAHFSFRPHWLGSSYPAIEKDNIQVFLSAFCQMVDAMRAIRNNTPFVRKEYTLTDIVNCLNIPPNALPGILGNSQQHIPSYSIEKNAINPQILKMFQDMAGIHLAQVVAFLNANHISI